MPISQQALARHCPSHAQRAAEIRPASLRTRVRGARKQVTGDSLQAPSLFVPTQGREVRFPFHRLATAGARPCEGGKDAGTWEATQKTAAHTFEEEFY